MMRPSKWELWFAKVAFDDGPTKIKERKERKK